MLTIYDGRSHFWQWDIGQKLKVDAGHACEVHFRNPDGPTALVVGTHTIDGQTVANVPNILLQDSGSVLAWVYICEGDECTRQEKRFEVWPRQKPADYVYTETELKTYEALEKRIDEIERNGISDEMAAETIEKYFERNPIESVPPVTEDDEGKVLAVVGGKWAAVELPKYDGAYEVKPLAGESTTLQTARKYMTGDVVVSQIPYGETSNASGGETAYIGMEVEIYGD